MGWGTVLGKAVKYGLKNPGSVAKAGVLLPMGAAGTAMAACAGWQAVFGDKALVQAVSDQVVGENGVVGAAGDIAVGRDNNVVDVAGERLLGQQRMNDIGNAASSVAKTAGNVVDGAGNVLSAVGNEAQRLYHGAGDVVSGVVHGAGQGQPQVQQPQGQQGVSDAQLYQAYQQQALSGQQSQGGMFGMLNPFNAISSLMGEMSNGGRGMSLAAMIPAAFLMFGNFGWMGKIASLFLGSLAMKNMRQQQAQQYGYSPAYLPQGVQSPQQAYLQIAQQQSQQSEESAGNVVQRGRGV